MNPSRIHRGLFTLFVTVVGAALLLLLLFLFVGLVTGRFGQRDDSAGLVLYCAQDQPFAESVLTEFTRHTGVRVRAVYDSEAVKTVGLANRLLAERPSPRAHVFWGNEELRTRQLAALGVFGTNRIAPGEGGWTAFGQRTRRLVVNTQRLPASERPGSLVELTNARWKGRISLASPLFGTTSTHFHALRASWGEAAWRDWCRALAANQPFIEEGNSHVVRRVARGEALVGLTDSDDIVVARKDGAPVEALDLEKDFLAIPNTVALVRPAPPGSPSRRLVAFLVSSEVSARLVAHGALESDAVTPGARIRPDWDRILANLDRTVADLEGIFGRR